MLWAAAALRLLHPALVFMIFCYASSLKTLVQAQNLETHRAIRVIIGGPCVPGLPDPTQHGAPRDRRPTWAGRAARAAARGCWATPRTSPRCWPSCIAASTPRSTPSLARSSGAHFLKIMKDLGVREGRRQPEGLRASPAPGRTRTPSPPPAEQRDRGQ